MNAAETYLTVLSEGIILILTLCAALCNFKGLKRLAVVKKVSPELRKSMALLIRYYRIVQIYQEGFRTVVPAKDYQKGFLTAFF